MKLFWYVTYFHNLTLSGTSANEIVTFNGKADVVELLSLSPYSSCTSNCIADIFFLWSYILTKDFLEKSIVESI